MSTNPREEVPAPAVEPKQCKMGCGFFGSGATGGLCSKCWREMQQKKNAAAVAASKTMPPIESTMSCSPTPMDIDTSTAVETMEDPVARGDTDITTTAVSNDASNIASDASAALSTITKRKKKKAGYKNMMADMMKGGNNSKKDDKEQLRKVTGGGEFSKIEKI